MAKSAKDESAVSEDAPKKMVLKKSHGLILHGRAHHFYPAGKEFDLEADATVIAQLVQSGAHFE